MTSCEELGDTIDGLLARLVEAAFRRPAPVRGQNAAHEAAHAAGRDDPHRAGRRVLESPEGVLPAGGARSMRKVREGLDQADGLDGELPGARARPARSSVPDRVVRLAPRSAIAARGRSSAIAELAARRHHGSAPRASPPSSGSRDPARTNGRQPDRQRGAPQQQRGWLRIANSRPAGDRARLTVESGGPRARSGARRAAGAAFPGASSPSAPRRTADGWPRTVDRRRDRRRARRCARSSTLPAHGGPARRRSTSPLPHGRIAGAAP